VNSTAVQRRRRVAILASLFLVVAFLATIPGIVRPQAAYATTTPTYAGNGTQGYSTGSGVATNAELNYPSALATDLSGNLYIADTYNELVREVSTSNGISNFYGTPQTAENESNGGLWHPSGVAVDHTGNVYISDTLNCVVWEVTPGGSHSVVAGSSSGCGSTSGKLDDPAGITYDTTTATIYIADQYNCEIKAVGGTNGIVAGNGTCGYSGDGSAATSAELNYPNSVAVANGKLYIADTSNSRIRVVDLSSGVISTFAGTGCACNSGNGGQASSAAVQTPAAVATDSAGDVFIGTGSGSVREVNSSNIINWIAGFSGSVTSLAVDNNENVYAGTTGYYVYRITGFWIPSGSTNFTVLGDSFSSGEGVPSFISPSDTDGCHRSYQAFAEDMNSSTGMALDNFAACSGATSTQVINGGPQGEGSQLSAISSSDKYMIISVGGDDIGFTDFVKACVALQCYGGSNPSTAYTDAENKIANNLPGNLATLFGDIVSHVSSGTRVLVIGYPQEIPAAGAPWLNPCSAIDNPDQTAAVQVESGLNTAIHSAVTSADTTYDQSPYNVSFEYVDPWDQFSGHQLCGYDPYFNGPSIPVGYSYHPNAEGQAAYSVAVETYLANHPTAP